MSKRLFNISFFFGLTLSMAQATVVEPASLYSSLTSYFPSDDQWNCVRRADVWAYELQKMTARKVAKVLVFYQEEFSEKKWPFHIAPVVEFDGKWIVFEKSNGITQPLELNSWMKELHRGFKCSVRDAVPNRVLKKYKREWDVRNRSSSEKDDKIHSEVSCDAVIVNVDVQSPLDKFLNFPGSDPTYLRENPVLDRERALSACLGEAAPESYVQSDSDTRITAREHCEDELNRIEKL